MGVLATTRRSGCAGLLAAALAGVVAAQAPGSGAARPQAGGEWVAVGGTERADVYMDPSTIERRSTLRSLWLLHDLRHADADGDRSWRVQVEYDCKHQIYRMLQVHYHGEGMGRGRARGRSGAASPWRAPEPDSINGRLMLALCAPPAR